MAEKARIKSKELEDLVDGFESSYMFEQPRPENVGLVNGYIHVHYDKVNRVAPLTQSDFFTSFAKLAAHGEPSEAKIKRWVGRFGLPVRGSRPEREGVQREDEGPEYKPVTMEVDNFRKEARFAHELLHLYSLVRARNVPAIKGIKRRFLSTPDEASPLHHKLVDLIRSNTRILLTRAEDKRIGSYPEAFQVGKRGSDSLAKMASHLAIPVDRDSTDVTATTASHIEFVSMMTILAAQSALGEIVTELVSNVRLRVGLQSGQGLVPSYDCLDLASALYLQFYLLITKNRVPRFCESPPCGELFFPSGDKHIYCSESCRSNARNYPKA